jgi:hypothetical protein
MNKIKYSGIIALAVLLFIVISGCDTSNNIGSSSDDESTNNGTFSVPVQAVYYKEYIDDGYYYGESAHGNITVYMLGVKLDLNSIPSDEIYCDDYGLLCTAADGRSIIWTRKGYETFFSSKDIDFAIRINSPYDKIADSGKRIYFDTNVSLYYVVSDHSEYSAGTYIYGKISTDSQIIDFSLMP